MLAAVKIVVCVKEVPETSGTPRIDPQTLRLDRTSTGVMNEFDTHALEEALRIREATGDGEVVLVSMAPARALESLRKALAMGADRVVLASDEAAAGSDLVATAKVLARALEREEPDLVLLGQQAADSVGAVLWGALADLLRLPVISQEATLELVDGKARVKRQTEYGYDVIEAPLPCLVAVSDAINDPRYPSLKGIMGAKKKPQETISLDALGLTPSDAGEAGSRTEVYALHDPPPRGEAERIEDEGDAAEKILDYLTSRKLV
jgi:electron transfer flavoprotein beta subunit